MQLTKDTDKMLCLIYEEFLNRRKLGLSKSDAKVFEYPSALQNQFLQGIHEDDIHDAILELHKNDLVKLYTDGGFYIKDESIIYMESRFKNGLKELLSYMSVFK